MALQMEDPVSEEEDLLSVDVSAEQGSTTVRLTGELDVSSAPALRRQLDQIEPTETVLLDVSSLAFLDSTGLGCFLRLQRRVGDAGGMVVVTGASRAIRRVMETTGLHRVMAILPEG
jgi:anti-anti-sigma factor